MLLQHPTTCVYPEPHQSSPRSSNRYFKIRFNIILRSRSRAWKVVPVLRVFSPKALSPSTRLCEMFCNMILFFYGEELLRVSPKPKLQDHPLSAVRHSFNIFAATFRIWTSSSPSMMSGLTYHGTVFCISWFIISILKHCILIPLSGSDIR